MICATSWMVCFRKTDWALREWRKGQMHGQESWCTVGHACSHRAAQWCVTSREPRHFCCVQQQGGPASLLGCLCRGVSGCSHLGGGSSSYGLCTHWPIICKHLCLHTLWTLTPRPEEGFAIPESYLGKPLPLSWAEALGSLPSLGPSQTLHVHSTSSTLYVFTQGFLHSPQMWAESPFMSISCWVEKKM